MPLRLRYNRAIAARMRLLMALIFLLSLLAFGYQYSHGLDLPSSSKNDLQQNSLQLQYAQILKEKRSATEKKLAPYNAIVGIASSNVPAYSNGNDSYISYQESYLDGVYMGIKWQCVEYARRWTYIRKSSVFKSIEGANDMWSQLTYVERVADKKRFPLKNHPNGSPNPPINESYLIYPIQKDMPYGHVAVIVDVLPNAIRIAEENFYFHYWTRNYAREIPVVFRDGRYFIDDKYSIYGWMEIDDNKQLQPLDKTKKCRPSITKSIQITSEPHQSVNKYNLKSCNAEPTTVFEQVETERQENVNTIAIYLTQLTIDEKDVIQHSQRDELINFPMDRYIDHGINSIVKRKFISSVENEQKMMRLKAKLEYDNELNITGILNLSSMNLIDNDLSLITQRLFHSEKKTCTGLILRNNILSSDGVKILVDNLLMRRIKLKCLCLSNNADIDDIGIEYLVRLLQENHSLTILSLPYTNITDRGVQLLANVLSGIDTDLSCSPLEKLDISFNKSITDESTDALMQIIEQNQTLKILGLQYCNLSDKARLQLRLARIRPHYRTQCFTSHCKKLLDLIYCSLSSTDSSEDNADY
ncbi:unnamed protein product [Adineta steineri]|uniref:Peptidase C51 domain-containing protein n=1 Tax=Adineta steineri TaxID=433720 RepID=A0A814ZIF0_9BILA|nr:unnamed protein product [Adineta steineri]CAF3562445.1 unnamed protein product [Adineta steineri]